MIAAFGWQWKRRRFGGIFPNAYKNAKERESFTTMQWQDFQNKSLQDLLQHAYHQVPYYHQLLREAGLSTAEIEKATPEILEKIPILPKKIMRQYATTTLLASQQERSGVFLNTSGSTGTPLQIKYSTGMHQRWFGIYESRVRNWAGVSSMECRGMIGGRKIVSGNKPPFHRYNPFEKQVYLSAYHISEANINHYVNALKKYGVTYMTGYTTSNYLLAAFLQNSGLAVPELKAILTSSFKLESHMRQLLEKVYAAKVFDSWGSVEACGLITECEAGSLHVSPDVGIIEILDEELKPLPPGVPGTVYCTGFINYDQPLIRYEIGDKMTWRAEQYCACGRQMPIIESIDGRVEDVIFTTDGRRMVYFPNLYFGITNIIQSQLIQHSLLEIELRLVVSNPLSIQDERMLKQRLYERLGNVLVMINYVPAIPLNSNGKYRSVISNIQPSDVFQK
jgi:phenylacetate-CoA ligase